MLQTIAANVSATGIGHVVIHVQDMAVARDFYGSVLGLALSDTILPGCGDSICLLTTRGHVLALAEANHRNNPILSAAHIGYAVSPKAHAHILQMARRRGCEIYTYREDRAIEAENNVYFSDPFGNRIQLIKDATASGLGVAGIDHVALEVADILWTELLFSELLGWRVLDRIGWNTGDYLKVRSAGEAGMRDAMPGSRYWNERYSRFETERRTLRPCPQLYYDLGDGATLVFYLAARHFQAAPDDTVVGTPRVGLTVAERELQALVGLFKSRDLTFEGPIQHKSSAPFTASLHLRDLCGNFIEFTARPNRAPR